MRKKRVMTKNNGNYILVGATPFDKYGVFDHITNEKPRFCRGFSFIIG